MSSNHNLPDLAYKHPAMANQYKTITRLFTTTILALILASCESPQQIKDTPEVTTQTSSDNPTQPSTTALSDLDQSRYLKAMELMAAENYSSAQKSLKKLSQKYRNHLAIKVNLAIAYFHQGDIKQADKTSQAALSIDNKAAPLHNLRGLIAVENKAFLEAQKAYNQAIALDQDYPEAYYNLALLYDIYFQDIPKAYQHYVKYLSFVPNDEKTKEWVEQLKYSLEQ